MDKIEGISLERLQNETCFKFLKRFADEVRELGAETLFLIPFWETYMSDLSKLDTALEVIRKSDYTRDLNILDKKRDDLFYGFKKNVKSFLTHFEQAKIDAARKILIVIDKYKQTPDSAYDTETARLYNLIQELNTNWQPQLTALSLTSWVVELDKANKAFDNKMKERSHEKEDRKLDYGVKDAREWMYVDYQQCCNRLMAATEFDTIDVNQECKKFVSLWNVIVKEAKNVLATHLGNLHANEDKDNGNSATKPNSNNN
jgi:hypothetical protein